ncbi:hypothetical protein [Clostridium akagii]|uniref:hypothetical protein n=1 Tax=Clostridium akagii TaxID=91623 RepID=UPI00047E59BA|nr:hypothetical protein [Clostridium akagii]
MAKENIKMIYKKDYNKYMKIFSEHLCDIDNYAYYKDLYKGIYDTYGEKIKNEELDVDVEIVRLKSKLGKFDTLTKNLNISLIFMGMSFFLNCLVLSYSQGDYSNNQKSIFSIILGATGLLAIILAVHKGMKRNEGYILDLSLQVIEDIEKEMKEDKSKNDLVLNEVAATLDTEDKLDIVLQNTKQIKEFLGIK